jgi:hypothetical protein
MWNDIDLYHDFRDFTTDPNSFPGEEMRTFIRHLHSQDQRCKWAGYRLTLMSRLPIYKLRYTHP